MLKKVAIVGAAGLLTAAVLTQTHVGGYLRHQFDRADKYLESQVPPEEEVARIKAEVANLYREFAQGYFAFFVSGPWSLAEVQKVVPDTDEALKDLGGAREIRRCGRE